MVITVYERTYRDALRPGHLHAVVASQRRPIDEVIVLINNVGDEQRASDLAEMAVARGEITGFSFVSDHLDAALCRTGLKRKRLGPRPYLVDYGLVMPEVVKTKWLLGWDAEATLVHPVNWIDPAIDFLESEPKVFHVSLNWPRYPNKPHSLAGDTWRRVGPYSLNYGFSDQLFLVDRERLSQAKLWRRPVPVALTRHAPYPYSFEFRVEGYQRVKGFYRATREDVIYTVGAGALIPGVLVRTGGETRWDHLRVKYLHALEARVLNRLPRRAGRFLKR